MSNRLLLVSIGERSRVNPVLGAARGEDRQEQEDRREKQQQSRGNHEDGRDAARHVQPTHLLAVGDQTGVERRHDDANVDKRQRETQSHQENSFAAVTQAESERGHQSVCDDRGLEEEEEGRRHGEVAKKSRRQHA